MKRLISSLFAIAFSSSVMAEAPVLVIGASFANGDTPINDNLEGPLGGISVGFGTYQSLGDALIRNPQLSGYVINEAQAGATTFTRTACNPVCNENIQWQGYDVQLTKALKRVSFPPAGIMTAKYVVVSISNDCLHSDAFGIDMAQTQPCNEQQMNEHADRMVALGKQAVDAGLTPIFLKSPDYSAYDMVKFQAVAGLSWVQDQANYEQMAQIRTARIAAEVPQAVQLDVWQDFTPLEADGIHPNAESVKKAAQTIATYIKQNEAQ